MASQSDSPSSVPVCPPLPQRPLPSPPSPSVPRPLPFLALLPYRYNGEPEGNVPFRLLRPPPSPVPFHSSPSSLTATMEKRKAIWTGVRGGLQNRSAAVEVVGVFDSDVLHSV